MVSAKQNMTALIKDKRGNIISIGKNSYVKTHPKMIKIAKRIGESNLHRIYIHAEIDAIVKCSNLERAFSIEVYRINKKIGYICSRPCIICATAILETDIKLIKYFNENKEVEEVTPEELIKYWKLRKHNKSTTPG